MCNLLPGKEHVRCVANYDWFTWNCINIEGVEAKGERVVSGCSGTALMLKAGRQRWGNT